MAQRILNRIGLITIFFLGTIWIWAQLPMGQKMIITFIEETAAKQIKADVSISHIDVVAPFFVRFREITIRDPNSQERIIHCQHLSLSSLLFDLFFHRLTFIHVRAKYLFIDLDRCNDLIGDQKNNGSFLSSLAVSSYTLKSVHVKKDDTFLFEGSLSGKGSF